MSARPPRRITRSVLVRFRSRSRTAAPKATGVRTAAQVHRRPWHVLAALGAGLHNGYELAAGAGLVGQSLLGLPVSLALWAAALPTWLRAAAIGGPRWDGVLAVAAGVSAAGGAVHFVLWPPDLRRGELMLAESSGIPRRLLPTYTAIVGCWTGASIVACAHTPPACRRKTLLGAATFPLLAWGALHQRHWLADEAQSHPAWWNRAEAGRRSPGLVSTERTQAMQRTAPR